MKGFPALGKPLFELYRSQQGLGEADLGTASCGGVEGGGLRVGFWKSTCLVPSGEGRQRKAGFLEVVWNGVNR